MKPFHNCRYDIAFKMLFCNENNTYLIKNFLKNTLGIEVEKLQFLNNELAINYLGERRKIVDSLMCVNDNIYIGVEVNYPRDSENSLRNYCFFQKIVSTKTESSQDYNVGDTFIQIDLSYKLNKKYGIIEEYRPRNKRGNLVYVENVKIIEYSMDKIINVWYDKNEEEIEKYKYLIMLGLNKKQLDIFCKKYEGDEYIMKYKERIEKLNNDKKFQRFVDYETDVRFKINTATNKGIATGIERGIKKGREQGIAKGLKEGREEGIATGCQQVAKNMLKKGISVSVISECTNIPEQQILNL